VEEDKHWRVWVIKRNRFDYVIEYIKESVPEVDKFFYPFIKKEIRTRSSSRIIDRPLYEGYLFLHYNNSPEVYHKLRANPFIMTYAGMASEDEMLRMEEAQGKLISEVKASRFAIGDVVRPLSGPFKGFDGSIAGIEGGALSIVIALKILGREKLEMVFSEDQVEKVNKLENARVQNI